MLDTGRPQRRPRQVAGDIRGFDDPDRGPVPAGGAAAPGAGVRAVLGLLVELPRKNCWTIAEHAGDLSPDGMQHLLTRARWDADGARDDERSYVVEHLGDPGGVLVVDETGDLKKGR